MMDVCRAIWRFLTTRTAAQTERVRHPRSESIAPQRMRRATRAPSRASAARMAAATTKCDAVVLSAATSGRVVNRQPPWTASSASRLAGRQARTRFCRCSRRGGRCKAPPDGSTSTQTRRSCLQGTKASGSCLWMRVRRAAERTEEVHDPREDEELERREGGSDRASVRLLAKVQRQRVK
jgi:hypothetical protein